MYSLSNCTIILFLTSFFLCILAFTHCKEKEVANPWNFSKGLRPIIFDPNKQNPINKENGLRMNRSEDCANCHEIVYKNWYRSKHRESFTNILYQQSHKQEPMTWCTNCHAPFLEPNKNANDPSERYLATEGISCHVCHVRNEKIIAARIPRLKENRSKHFHEYSIEENLAKSEFCASCHQFNFPKLIKEKGKEVSYSNLPMQDTYSEFLSTGYQKFGNCQDCHLVPNSLRSHSFPGGHNRDFLKESLHANITRLGEKTINIDIISIGIPHAFPTGDLFRTLKIIVKNNKQEVIEELFLRKTYIDTWSQSPTNSDLPTRTLIKDTRIPPPSHDFSSKRTFFVSIQGNEKYLDLDFFMDYLSPSSRFTNELPIKETIMHIKTIRMEIPKYDGTSG
jgi:hypothetical protein